MDKEAWNKLKKDLNKLPAREKLLYLKGILKVVKEKELKEEILLELKKTQEIIDNETIPVPERATIPIPEPIRLRRERPGLEQDIGKLDVSAKNVGISTPPMRDQLESLKTRIFQGASQIELGFMGA